MSELNFSNDSPEKSASTLEEIIAIRRELEHLQDRSLVNIWEQIKDLNKQNAALLKEISLLRKNLAYQIAFSLIIVTPMMSLFTFYIILFVTTGTLTIFPD